MGLDQHHRLDAKFAEVSRGPQRTAWVGFTSQNNDSVTKDNTKMAEETGLAGTPRTTTTQWNCGEHSTD